MKKYNQNMNMNMLEYDNVVVQTLDPIQHILDKLPYEDQVDIVDFFIELNEKKIQDLYKIEEVK